MRLFRAVPTDHPSRDGTPQRPRDTVRLPGNVPYVIDNLWEHLRPDHLPSRRHAVYASPTPELALRCATSDRTTVELVADELVIDGPCKLTQLRIEDARHHADIGEVLRTLQKAAPALLAAPLPERQAASLLFMPGCSKADWMHAVQQSPAAADFSAAASALSTFWGDAATEPTDAAGELFFELGAGASYRLISVVSSNAAEQAGRG